MMNYSDYEKEFREFCNTGKTMTGQEIINWCFTRINVPHRELSLCADRVREKYIDTDKPISRKVYYDVLFWSEEKSELGCLSYGEYVQVRRNLNKSPRYNKEVFYREKEKRYE